MKNKLIVLKGIFSLKENLKRYSIYDLKGNFLDRYIEKTDSNNKKLREINKDYLSLNKLNFKNLKLKFPIDSPKKVDKFLNVLKFEKTENLDKSLESLEILKFKPKKEQEEVLQQLNQFFKSNNKKGYIILPTGYGKTFVSLWSALNYLKNYGKEKRVLFLTHLSGVLTQTVEDYDGISNGSVTFKTGIEKNYDGNIKIWASESSVRNSSDKYQFPKMNLKPSSYQKKKGSIKRKDLNGINLVIGLVDSLTTDLNEKYFFDKNDFDYIIVDEMHHSVANNFQMLLNHFNSSKLLGLTATPDRTDDKKDLIPEVFNSNLLYEKHIEDGISEGLLANVDYIIKDIRNFDEETIKFLVEDSTSNYNNTIQKLSKMLSKNSIEIKNKKSLIFCNSVKTAIELSKVIPNSTFLSSVDIDGSTISKSNINKKIKDFKTGKIKCIISYDILNEGFNVPDCDLIIFLRPTISTRIWLQQLGRGLRKTSTNSRLLIHDYVGYYGMDQIGEETIYMSKQKLYFLKTKRDVLAKLKENNKNNLENIELINTYLDSFDPEKRKEKQRQFFEQKVHNELKKKDNIEKLLDFLVNYFIPLKKRNSNLNFKNIEITLIRKIAGEVLVSVEHRKDFCNDLLFSSRKKTILNSLKIAFEFEENYDLSNGDKELKSLKRILQDIENEIILETIPLIDEYVYGNNMYLDKTLNYYTTKFVPFWNYIYEIYKVFKKNKEFVKFFDEFSRKRIIGLWEEEYQEKNNLKGTGLKSYYELNMKM